MYKKEKSTLGFCIKSKIDLSLIIKEYKDNKIEDFIYHSSNKCIIVFNTLSLVIDFNDIKMPFSVINK